MAEGSFKRTSASVLQAKKPQSSGNKTERSKRCEARSQVNSAPGPTKNPSDDLFAKEEHYKLINAEIEAKTADLVRMAEQLMKDQTEVLSKPFSTHLGTYHKNDEDARVMTPSRDRSLQGPQVKVETMQQTTTKNENTKKQLKKKISPKMLSVDVSEEFTDNFLAKTIQNMEERMDDTQIEKEDVPAGDINASGVSDAQIRVLKAKLRIMQEELDQLTSEYYKKDDENVKLYAKIKELEEERARLQKTTSIQQTQTDKHKALAEESAKKFEGLQLQVAGLNKEIENLNRSHKQAAAVHSTVEIRLNRALEESQRLKSQLNKIKQINKDQVNEEHQSKESLVAENKILKKQKAELIVGFKKQLKLIDILKRQKMHFEAAKLLSFTEEEFMKALDWEKS